MAEVLQTIRVSKVDFDEHVLDAYLLMQGSLLDGVKNNAQGDEVVSEDRLARHREDMFQVETFLRNESVEPGLEGTGGHVQ